MDLRRQGRTVRSAAVPALPAWRPGRAAGVTEPWLGREALEAEFAGGGAVARGPRARAWSGRVRLARMKVSLQLIPEQPAEAAGRGGAVR